MEGMNVVFHAGSLIAALALGWALATARARRAFVLKMIKAAGGGTRTVDVAEPAAWLGQFARAFDIPVENTAGYDLPPRRIEGWVAAEVFLRSTITLIRCGANPAAEKGLAIEVTLAAKQEPAAAADLGARLASALGDGIAVKLA